MKITALLLNWKRQENIVKVIDSIKKQSVKIDIWLWNNNIEDKTKYDVDVQINSTTNFKCWPRWLMGSMVNDGYIFTLDDDIMFNRNDVIETCIKEYESIKNSHSNPIIGYSGVIVNEEKNYWSSQHMHQPEKNNNIIVDVIKGRFMFMDSNILSNVSLENEPTCEDIKISSYSEYKLIPKSLFGGLVNLTEGVEALHQNPTQREKRIVALKKYFK
jgi:hypothetical protein